MRIQLIKNTFYNELHTKEKLCKFIMGAEKLSMGEQCALAEENFAKFVGRKHSVLFNSGSSANLGLIQAYLNLGRLKPGARVGFSSLTWSTNIMPLIQLGLAPVPIDVDLSTLNVMSGELKKAIDEYKIEAFFSTNILGFCGDLENIKKLCDEKNVLFIEDNCESLGSVYKGKPVGGYGEAATCSFYVGHHLSTIEGGVVTCDDEELYKMLAIVRAHGWDRNLSGSDQKEIRNRFGIFSDFYDKYTFYDIGFNLRPTEITGFLLNENLLYAEEIFARREKIFLRLYNFFAKTIGEEIYLLKYDHLDRLSNFAIPIVCKTKEYFSHLIQKLDNRGIETRPMVAGNILKQPFYRKYIGENYGITDNSNINIIHERGLYIGNNPDLTDEELDYMEQSFL